MSSHNNSSTVANDPRQPYTAKPFVAPKVSAQDLPVDYSGFIAVIFGIAGVMFRAYKLETVQKVARASQIILASFPGCGLYYSYGTPGSFMAIRKQVRRMVILRLIIHSPDLEELQISGSSNLSLSSEVFDLDIWENECPSDCALKCLKTVKMTDISGLLHEMRFINFLLENSPILEIMSVTPSVYVIELEGRMHMVTELLEFRRVSPLARIKFSAD